jgi:hypothetical protein
MRGENVDKRKIFLEIKKNKEREQKLGFEVPN